MKDKSQPFQSASSKPLFKVFKWLLLLLLIFAAIYLMSNPLRVSSANQYLNEGDNYLAQGKYLHASLSYNKALVLNKNKIIEERLALIEKSSNDISTLESFFQEKYPDEFTKLQDAKAVPANESDAVKKSKELIEQNQFQLAILPAKTAIEMDPAYRDAWLYLGIANLKCGQNLEVKSEITLKYLNSAKEALEKAKEIDPTYQPTIDYLQALNN